jgi:3-oxoacyl-[acyl-carrier protein] reductase
MTEWTGRRVVVMGGSRGIGRSIALGFAAGGAAVAICARGPEALERTRGELGTGAFAASVDLADADAIARFVPQAAEALGGIDVLINNGTGFGFADDEESWMSGIQVDLLAAVRASRAALPFLKASPHASILHTTSIAALRPRGSGAPYAAVKAALTHYAGSQALALATDGIRVNAIAPGSIAFADGLWEQRRTQEPDVYNATLAKIPFGRFGTPEEVAHAALFLASPYASWITGHTLVVDGGQMLNG